MSCIEKTVTDRGVALYVAELIPCRCLDKIKEKSKIMPVTKKCWACETQHPQKDMKRCGRCLIACYCDQKCQKQDWIKGGHKKNCEKPKE